MTITNKNIEEWFLKQPPSMFPDDQNYVSKYITIRDYMNRQIHSEIKAIVVQLLPGTYLNDHGEKHIKKVIEKASEIIDITEDVLTPYEVFFLLLSIQIHDAGHIINGRKGHEESARNIINKFGAESITSVEKKYVSSIAKAHSGKNDPIGNLAEDQVVSNKGVDLKFIASILRLADELADDATRASTFLLEHEKISNESKIYHEYSASLDSCVAKTGTHQIKMNFYLNEGHLSNKYLDVSLNDVFLLDEIYKRTIKTYLECIYCNRFLPEKYRYTTVDVDIYIESTSEHIVPNPVSFRLMEKGYPELVNKSIFEICGDDLKIEGKILDGNYYCNLIPKQTNDEQKSI